GNRCANSGCRRSWIPSCCRNRNQNPPTGNSNPPGCVRSRPRRRLAVSDPLSLALLILALPLAAAILGALLSKSSLRTTANWPLVLACATAAVLAFVLQARVADEPKRQFLSQPATWFAAGKLRVNFTINLDPLAAIMLAMITFVSTWIATFSSGYMKGDRGYARFFAIMSLFVFSMC